MTTQQAAQAPDDLLSQILAELSPDDLPEFPSAALPGSQPKQRPPPAPSVWKDFISLGIKLGAIIAAVALAFTFLYGLHYNVDPSMVPAMKDGDLAMYYRLDKNYHAGDLCLLTFQGKKQVRRVIATAGDTVDITEEGLTINGAPQQERGIYRPTERYAEGVDFPLTLGENEIFLLGDAREGVTDSRVYGAVNVKDTAGTVIAVFRRRSL